jgi:hypothetical protein
MALLLWARFALLAALATVIAGYVWAGLEEPDE